MTLLTLALISFAQVFALGFQSRNVNAHNYGWAFATSLMIGASQAAVWRRITDAASGPLEVLVYAGSGAIGIVCAMWTHEKFIRRS